MLLRFVPASPTRSTIIFSLSFTPTGLPNPLSVTQQIQQLLDDKLELPQDWYTLDKAVGLASLIAELSFSAKEELVSCRMTDGETYEWPLFGACLDVLQLVSSDVSDASIVEQGKQPPGLPPTLDTPALDDRLALSLNRFQNRHTKQRSLLMSSLLSLGKYVN